MRRQRVRSRARAWPASRHPRRPIAGLGAATVDGDQVHHPQHRQRDGRADRDRRQRTDPAAVQHLFREELSDAPSQPRENGENDRFHVVDRNRCNSPEAAPHAVRRSQSMLISSQRPASFWRSWLSWRRARDGQHGFQLEHRRAGVRRGRQPRLEALDVHVHLAEQVGQRGARGPAGRCRCRRGGRAARRRAAGGRPAGGGGAELGLHAAALREVAAARGRAARARRRRRRRPAPSSRTARAG